MTRATAIACCVLAGCSWKEIGRSTTSTDYSYGQPSLVGSSVSGTGRVLPDGTVRVELKAAGRCDRPATAIHSIAITERRDLSPGKRHSLGIHAGLAGGGGGVALMLAGNDAAGGALIAGGIGLIGYSLWVLSADDSKRTRSITEPGDTAREPVTCPADLTASGELPEAVELTTPWGQKVVAQVEGEHASFEIDWARARLDPTLPGTRASLERLEWSASWPGMVGSISWTSTASDAGAMASAIARARDVDWTVQSGGPPPSLRAAATIGGNGPIHYETRVPIRVTVTNGGPGDAYRVVATTKSGRPELNKLRLVFGRIRAGESKTRAVAVALPRASAMTREVVLIRFEEANEHPIPELTRAIEIQPALRPRLALRCGLEGPVRVEAGRSVIDAGETFTVWCAVRNAGQAVAKRPALSVTFDNKTRTARGPDLPAGKTVTLKVKLQVPAGAQLDTPLRMAARASERNFGDQETRYLYAKVGKPKLCPKKLSVAEYQKEKKTYEKLLRAGDITQAEFDAYHAELVRCLK